MKHVIIHTDGACKGNPGPGGIGIVMQYGDVKREFSAFYSDTTNNQMELLAAVIALERLREPCLVDVWTDSKYLANGMTSWLPKWKSKQWKTSSKKPVKNIDLWKRLDSLASKHRITWHWLRGHSGHAENERCDRLANEAIAKGLHSGEATL